MLDNLTDWDIPVTDEFVTRVHRGVRRRRRLRVVSAAAAFLAVAGIATAALAISRPPERAQTLPVPAASTQVVDGFQVNHLPAGAVRAATADSSDRYPVTEDGPALSVSPTKPLAAGDPAVRVTMRRFDRGVGISLYVTVLRPDPPGRQAGAWLSAWAARGATTMQSDSAPASPAASFATPVGPGRLLAHVGTEVTTYEVVITTLDQVVITIQANGAFTAAELTETARGIS